MTIMRSVIAVSVLFFCIANSKAAETTAYTYDALGRLSGTEAVGGPANGLKLVIQYDAAGNRTNLNVTGSASLQQASLTSAGPVGQATAEGVVLSVRISGTAPTGTVSFFKNGTFLGEAWVIDGAATVIVEDIPAGKHVIVAKYSGDKSNHPNTASFAVQIASAVRPASEQAK